MGSLPLLEPHQPLPVAQYLTASDAHFHVSMSGRNSSSQSIHLGVVVRARRGALLLPAMHKLLVTSKGGRHGCEAAVFTHGGCDSAVIEATPATAEGTAPSAQMRW